MGRECELQHDNRIYETANLLVFSDACSDAIKRETAQIMETVLLELRQSFGVANAAELGITDQGTKVKVYLNRNNRNRTSLAFPRGLIVDSPDSPILEGFDEGSPGRYTRLLKHEFMHVFQYLLGLGLDGYDDWPEIWFSEGIAEHISGGVMYRITTLTQLNQWRRAADHTNPICVHRWNDYPVPMGRIAEFYPMFNLAVTYLLDSSGHGRQLTDVRAMFESLKNGSLFPEAFEAHFSMSVSYFEEHFFELIEEYLPVAVSQRWTGSGLEAGWEPPARSFAPGFKGQRQPVSRRDAGPLQVGTITR